jgi:hypothetical protein
MAGFLALKYLKNKDEINKGYLLVAGGLDPIYHKISSRLILYEVSFL